MPTTLTLKSIPDEVYERLKASAEAHRRSLNSEASEFVALAMRLGVKVVTMDKKRLKAFPKHTTPLSAARRGLR